MNGYDATGQIRRLNGPNRRVPVIAMTAQALDGIRDRCLRAGMNDYITKPVDPQAMFAVLARWLRAAPPVRAAAAISRNDSRRTAGSAPR
jgi:hypothetical protein